MDMIVYEYTLRRKGAKWHPFRVIWAVPILAPPNGATKNPSGGFFWKNPFKNPNVGFFESHTLGAEKNHLGFFIEPCGIHEGFFEEPHGIHITTLFLTLGDLKSCIVNYRILFWTFIAIEKNLTVIMKDASTIFRACYIIQICDHCVTL